jgi:pilus assembly protein CpaE
MMMKRIVIADSDHDELVIAQSVIGTLDELEVVGDTTSYSLLPSLIERLQPDYVMIAMRYRANDTVDAVNTIRKSKSTCQIIIVSDQPDAEDILLCLRAGANEFISTPLDTDELLNVVERLNQKPVPQSAIKELDSTGKLTAVCGCRGGSGTTTLAVNLAEHLSHHAPTALVDFHFGQGDLAVYLNITPSITLADVQQTSERLDDSLIESATYKHTEKFHLLLQAPDNAKQRWSQNDILQLIKSLRRKYEHVVVDCGTDVELLNGLQEQLHQCLLVMKQDMASLLLAQVKLGYLKQMELSDEQITVAINAYTKTSVITPTRIAKVLQRTEFALIREEEKVVQTAMNRGVPVREISRWSRSAHDIKKIAEQLTGEKITTMQITQTKDAKEIQLRPLAVYQTAEPVL